MSEDCYVFGVQLDGKGGGVEIDDAPSTAEGQVWLHLDYSSGDAEGWLRARGVEPMIAESLVRSDTRPRALRVDEGAVVLLRGVNLNPGADPEDMVSLRMWIEPNRLITVRQRRLLSVQDVRQTLQIGRGPADISELVTTIIERLADRVADVVDAIEENMSVFEDQAISRDAADVRHEVTALRRQVAVVRRFLAPQRDALDNLFRYARGLLDEEQAFGVREQADRITRYVEDLDLVRERALVVQEELLNRIAQEQNARMYVLSVVAALFLPITFITGLFGMNVAGLPGTEETLSFWLVTGVMTIVSVGVLVLFWLKRWF